MEPFRNMLMIFIGASMSVLLMSVSIDTKPKEIVKVKTKVIEVQPQEIKFSKTNLLKLLQKLNIKNYRIIYAQAVLETGHFRSKSFTQGNNLFGMKVAKSRPTTNSGEYLGHAKYNSWQESVYDYALYYSKYLSKFKTEESYFDYLKQHYAEDPNYINKLKIIMN